jgi:predicted amidophosphoribosyltransferase
MLRTQSCFGQNLNQVADETVASRKERTLAPKKNDDKIHTEKDHREVRDGVALDLHTLSSEFIGYDEFGHARFDTVRSPICELLYKLKYGSDKTAIDGIAEATEELLAKWKPAVDILGPVPSSTPRPWQPVTVLAEAISKRTGIALVDCITRTRDAPQLKNVFDLDQRLKLPDGLHAVNKTATQDKSILLFDDLYRSGATMNAITEVLYTDGKAKNVFALTVTRTRSNQ